MSGTDLSAATLATSRLEIIRRLRKQVNGDGLPDLADSVYEEPSEAYTDPERFERERHRVFLGYPSFAAFSVELRNPGDFRSLDLAGVPIVLLRGRDGVLRGFRNACIHRGAMLTDREQGCGLRRFKCPYHGWTYDEQGRLIGIPGRAGFPGVEPGTSGLSPVRVIEKYGLVFVQVEGGFEDDNAEQHLGLVANHLEQYDFGSWIVRGPSTVHVRANWKLAMDTFCESYHFPTLHRNTFLADVVGMCMTFDLWDAHVQQVFPLASVRDLSDDEATWGSEGGIDHVNPIWLISPNLVIAGVERAGEVFVVHPGPSVEECSVSHYRIFSPTLPEEVREPMDQFYEKAWNDVIIPEDMNVAESMWRSLKAGSVPFVRYGRSEGPLQHMHRQVDKLLGTSNGVIREG